jgi:hypothetical protein
VPQHELLLVVVRGDADTSFGTPLPLVGHQTSCELAVGQAPLLFGERFPPPPPCNSRRPSFLQELCRLRASLLLALMREFLGRVAAGWRNSAAKRCWHPRGAQPT